MVSSSLEISEARRLFMQLDERLRDERVIKVTRHNKPVFAVVDLEYLAAVLETIDILSDPESSRVFRESLDDIRNGRVHDHEDVKRELLGD